MKIFFSITLLGIILISCNNIEINNQAKVDDPLVSHIDSTVKASENFFYHANGNWFKNNPIPETDASNGIFKTIQDTINSQILQICEKAAENTSAKKGSDEQKIGDFYFSGMDSISINKKGISPLKKELKTIDNIKDISNLLDVTAHLHTLGSSPIFNFYVGQDDKNSAEYALILNQGGYALGEKDYYLNNDPEISKVRNEYIKHLEAIQVLAGNDKTTAKKNASTIFKIEKDFAIHSRSLEEQRDPVKNYNKFTIKDFNKTTSNINWNKIFNIYGVSKAESIIVRQPEFFTNLNTMLKSYSIEEWKVYLKWNLINTYASELSKDFQDQNFKFYGTVLSGIKKQKPRWKSIVDQTDEYFGELIGKVYVKDYLPKGTKEKLLEIGNSIRDVYAEHIKNLDWMSATTKKKALHKLSKIVMKVGYPDKWKDMSDLKITRNSYCENVMNCNNWGFKEMIHHYGKPVDKSEWHMYPQTYNAYYDPSNNEIVVPACNIIVPGFEGRMPDDAILYGIIGGSTFGHEITHGFDDQGCQYDEKGNLNNWWTAEDYKKFTAKTKLIVEQFDNFKVLKNKHVNGALTQGENIADLGGVVMGLEAFKKTKQYKTNQIISGQTPIERFFLAYGYAWMVNIKDEALANQIMTDVHAPAQFRINGPVANVKEFYSTFKIKKGDKMYVDPKKRVEIW